MMMTMDQSSGFGKILTNFPNQKLFTDPDVDWSVFENADRYLLRDDSAWITRLSKDFWWNLERISEMTRTIDGNPAPSMPSTKIFPPQNFSSSSSSSSMQLNNLPTRKIVGQRSTITQPNPTNIPEKINSDEDIEYNPFHSNISFDNHIWTNFFQQTIPWQ